jgi:transposase-like protein
MKKTRRRYDREFKISVIAELEGGKLLSQIAYEYGVHPSLPHRCRDLDHDMFHDAYRDKIEALISSRLKGEAVQVEWQKPKKPTAKSMMEALRETAESFK